MQPRVCRPIGLDARPAGTSIRLNRITLLEHSTKDRDRAEIWLISGPRLVGKAPATQSPPGGAAFPIRRLGGTQVIGASFSCVKRR